MMDASRLQANHLSGAVGLNSGNEHSQDSALLLWQQLLQNPRFSEYARQIQACLVAKDKLWSTILTLRTDPDASDLLEALHMSTIYLIPPSDVWDLLVGLRSHRSWASVRSTVLSQMGNPRHLSYSTASSRSSALSNRNYAGLSYGSGGRSSSIPSSYGIIGTVEEAEEEDIQSRPPQLDIPNVGMTVSGKASRKAPDGTKFFCPHTPCRGKFQFKRRGDWINHVIKYHQGSPDADPFEFLQKDFDVSPQTPVNGDKAEFPPSFAIRSSSRGHSQVSTVNDFPATGPEYHLPMHQLIENGSAFSAVSHTEHFGRTGVYAMHVDTGQSHDSGAGADQHFSYFNHDDEMDNKDW